MQHPRDPFSDGTEDDAVARPALPRRTSRSGHQPGGEFSRPRSSPQPPTTPLPAPATPPAPPETHHAEAGAPPEPSYSAPESQVLFESWQPPDEPADPWWDVPFRSSDELLAPEFSEPPAVLLDRVLAGPPPPHGPGHGPGPGAGGRPDRRPGGPSWDGPKHARHQQQRRRRGGQGHWGGAILALTGALALAGAVPLGILGVRTLADRPAPTLTASPMSNGSPISAPASAPAAAPSQLSQGQTAAGPGTAASSSPSAAGSQGGTSGTASGAKAATFAFTAGPGCRSLNGVITFPYQAPAGDGWHPATAGRNGPCGASFTYSLLANVRNASGDWHDHYAWIFHTGKQVASCTLSFYIPPSAHANSSAFYWFSAGSDNPGKRMADFSIDQESTQGQWVTKGPFTFPGGTVLVELTDRGVGPLQDTVEAGVLQLRCV